MSDKPHTNRPAAWEMDEAALKASLARHKAVAKQAEIEIEEHVPLAGQRSLLPNEPGPQSDFKRETSESQPNPPQHYRRKP